MSRVFRPAGRLIASLIISLLFVASFVPATVSAGTAIAAEDGEVSSI
jgi:hypothetical protein